MPQAGAEASRLRTKESGARDFDWKPTFIPRTKGHVNAPLDMIGDIASDPEAAGFHAKHAKNFRPEAMGSAVLGNVASGGGTTKMECATEPPSIGAANSCSHRRACISLCAQGAGPAGHAELHRDVQR